MVFPFSLEYMTLPHVSLRMTLEYLVAMLAVLSAMPIRARFVVGLFFDDSVFQVDSQTFG